MATTRWARLLPATILSAAGLPLVSSSPRTLHLTYRAIVGGPASVQAHIALTFGPTDPTIEGALAPRVPPVVSGSTIPVSYDLSRVRRLTSPALRVSLQGRYDTAQGAYSAMYRVPLTTPKGSVQIPLAALRGGGIYGVAIDLGTSNGVTISSDTAIVRVAGTPAARPPAPQLADATAGGTPTYDLILPPLGSARIAWSVANVPHADGALLEVSARGPSLYGQWALFNNPNGSRPDRDGVDSPSVFTLQLAGTVGTIAFGEAALHLEQTMVDSVRVIPTQGGVPIGEAGEVATIQRSGVVPDDGGQVGAFGVNASGNDGFLISQQSASSTFETWDQRSEAVTGDVAQFFWPLTLTAPTQITGGDYALYFLPNTDGTIAQGMFVTQPGAPSQFPGVFLNFPIKYQLFGTTPANVQTSTAVITGISLIDQWQYAFSADPANNAVGKQIRLSGIFPTAPGSVANPTTPVWNGALAFDSTNGIAYFGGTRSLQFCPNTTDTLGLVDMVSGKQKTVNAGGVHFELNTMGFDSTHGVLAVGGTACGENGEIVRFFDRNQRATQTVPLPGLGISGLGFDETNGLLFAFQVNGPDAATNNDALPLIYEIDETGRIVKTFELALPLGVPQADPARRTLYWNNFYNGIHPIAY